MNSLPIPLFLINILHAFAAGITKPTETVRVVDRGVWAYLLPGGCVISTKTIVRALVALIIFGFVVPSAFAGGGREVGDRISPADAYEMYTAGEAILVDVRDADSYVDGHLEGAFSVPLGTVRARATELGADGQTIIAYCSCPAEESSLAAAADLVASGVTNVYVLDGGIAAWAEAGLPLRRGDRP